MKQTLPILADIANGLFAVLLAGYITDIEIVWWHFGAGVVFAMLPDLDAVPELLMRGKIAASSEHMYDHREALHLPIIFLLAGVSLVFVAGFFGWIFLLATMFHFINDLYGTGWGVPVLWPLSRTRYKIFTRKVNRLKPMLLENGDWKDLSHEERKIRLICSWTREELPNYIKRWGDEVWIDRWYCKLNIISILEYTLFLVAVSLSLQALLY